MSPISIVQSIDGVQPRQVVSSSLPAEDAIKPATSTDDAELLQKISRRDANAFAALYDRYATVLYSLCLAVLKKPDEAEDVLQECFLTVWEKAFAFNGMKGSAYTWLVTLTRHRAIDRLRSKNFQMRLQKPVDFDFDAIADDGANTPLELTSFAERAEIVQKAFATLPVEQREVLRLAYFEGCSQSEIAGQLRVPLGTVKTRARQAMKKLHKLLAANLQALR
ncbi:MAG: sigma-70 family RNA polymerase sigma factor [bacterium]